MFFITKMSVILCKPCGDLCINHGVNRLTELIESLRAARGQNFKSHEMYATVLLQNGTNVIFEFIVQILFCPGNEGASHMWQDIAHSAEETNRIIGAWCERDGCEIPLLHCCRAIVVLVSSPPFGNYVNNNCYQLLFDHVQWCMSYMYMRSWNLWFWFLI